MNKELKKLTPLELWKNFLLLVEAPAKARLLDCECKDGLEQYDYFKAEIENALKNYEELTNKPVMFCRSTHGSKQALIDMICKNHKEVKITCLEDEKKLKALEIIIAKPRTLFLVQTCENYDIYLALAQDIALIEDIYSPKEFDLLKEVLL